MLLRRASLNDTEAIVGLFTNSVEAWQRFDAQGRVQDVSYGDLSIEERWQYGGAWMSIETAAIWLSHLLNSGCEALVIEDEGRVVGYIEGYIGHEPAPFGRHLHIQYLRVMDDGIIEWVLDEIEAQYPRVERLTVSHQRTNETGDNPYEAYGFSELERRFPVSVAPVSGQVGFYKVSDGERRDYAKIEGWLMPIGRGESARAHWAAVWSVLWGAIPAVDDVMLLKQFNVSGQEAYVCLMLNPYDRRVADVLCWTSKPLTPPLVNSIREWSSQAGLRTLNLVVSEKMLKLLPDAQQAPYQQVIFARERVM